MGYHTLQATVRVPDDDPPGTNRVAVWRERSESTYGVDVSIVSAEDIGGWRTRETWQANLWISNDEYLSRMVQDTIDANGGADAASLRLTVEGYMEGVSAYGNGGLLGDIIGLWLDRVDWSALAESYADWT